MIYLVSVIIWSIGLVFDKEVFAFTSESAQLLAVQFFAEKYNTDEVDVSPIAVCKVV